MKRLETKHARFLIIIAETVLKVEDHLVTLVGQVHSISQLLFEQTFGPASFVSGRTHVDAMKCVGPEKNELNILINTNSALKLFNQVLP